MNEKDKASGQFRVAIIVPVAIREDEESFEVLARVTGTDPEIMDEATKQLEEEVGSPFLRLTPEQVRMERNRFCFSSSTWKARWQPTGPKTPGSPPRLN